MFGQTVASAQYSGEGYRVVLTDGNVVSVPNDPGNRFYKALQAWVAAGNTIAAEPTIPVAQRRAEVLRQIETLQVRILALERLKIRIPARETQIQAIIDNLDAQIEALIPQS